MHHHDAGCFVHTFPLFCSVWCYACHACLCHSLAFYASLHACLHVPNEFCLLVCRPYFKAMKLWTFDPNLRLSLTDTTFCLLSYMFAFSLVCLLSCFFACYVYHSYLLYASLICSSHLFLPLLVCWFLVFAFACTHMEWGRIELGIVSQVKAKRVKIQACRYKPSGYAQ